MDGEQRAREQRATEGWVDNIRDEGQNKFKKCREKCDGGGSMMQVNGDRQRRAEKTDLPFLEHLPLPYTIILSDRTFTPVQLPLC